MLISMSKSDDLKDWLSAKSHQSGLALRGRGSSVTRPEESERKDGQYLDANGFDAHLRCTIVTTPLL